MMEGFNPLYASLTAPCARSGWAFNSNPIGPYLTGYPDVGYHGDRRAWEAGCAAGCAQGSGWTAAPSFQDEGAY